METVFSQLGDFVGGIQILFSAAKPVFVSYGFDVRSVRARVQSCLSVHPSERMEQLGSHSTVFHEIGYFSIFRKPVAKIQVSLKSEKNSGYFT
jgi:hypothetical protein